MSKQVAFKTSFNAYGYDYKKSDTMRKALRDALNNTGRDLKTFAKRDVTQAFNIKSRDAQDNLSLSKATINSLIVKFSSQQSKIDLVQFGAKQEKRGVSVMVRRGRRFVSVGTFVAIPTKGGRYGGKPGVYIRQHYLDDPNKRYPIRRLFGPSVAQMFTTIVARRKYEEFVAQNLAKQVANQFKRYKIS